MKKLALIFLLFVCCGSAFAQGTLSGDFQSNINFYVKDTNVGAGNNPLYDNALSGSDAWLTLRYAVNGYTFFLRADAFSNSNLKQLVSPNTDFGIGAWSITKEFDDLTITAGSIYDQIGTGILFRSYENRALLIDNALMGVELKYKFSDHFSAKAFTGQQKNNNVDNNFVNNVRYLPVIKGISGEGDVNVGNVHLTPGFGILNRTLDAASMASLVTNINAQADKFEPKYNMYAFSLNNNLIYKAFSWYMEGAYKTREAITENNHLYNKDGNVLYTNMSYGMKGLALSLFGKRSQDFVMRIDPSQTALKGMLNWQPIIAVLRPQRLMARYTPQYSDDLSEQSATLNGVVTPNDVTTINLTYSHINTLKNEKLYREVFAEIMYQGFDKWTLEGGVQYMEYNILLYQNRSSSEYAPVQYAVTPFTEITYKMDDKRSLRFEAQYMFAHHDYGSWAYALIEYDIAPKFSLAISDMYNVSPNPNEDNIKYKNPGNHFYQFFTAYTKGPHRFTLAYVKQVDGINCSGGVCRYEPAFSGVKGSVTTSF